MVPSTMDKPWRDPELVAVREARAKRFAEARERMEQERRTGAHLQPRIGPSVEPRGYFGKLNAHCRAKHDENLWGMVKLMVVTAGYFLGMPFVLAWNVFVIFVMPWRD